MKIVFDIGGTKSRVASSIDGKVLNQVEIIRTEQNYSAALELLIEQIEKLSKKKKIATIAGGVPGTLNSIKTSLIRAANLHPWENKPLAEDLSKKFKCPVKLENDGVLGALAEANCGAGQDFETVAYITIGTGIGGGYVVRKKLSPASLLFKPGHHVLDPNGPICPGDGVIGHWEAYLHTEHFSHSLPKGLAETLQRWPAEVVVLGGGVTLHANWDLEKLKKDLSALIGQPAPEIKIAALSDDSGLYGALTLLN